ncbi:CRAL-TRIO domain-containing protein [Mycena olivaceomarginata]|nr:CRAL-TRIO domain-containing protein [Mycena olivaceomarginata]
MATPAPASTGTWTPPPGRLGNLTPTQEAALAKFGAELRAEGAWVEARHDDATLLRFLRARKFDVPKAKEMILACEKWRKEFGVDELVRSFKFTELKEVDKYYPQYYHAQSGRPIYIERIGALNVKALYACTSLDRLLSHLVVEYESFLTTRLPSCSSAIGHPVDTSLTILDLGGVSLSNFIRVKDYVRAATNIGQNYYPECMGAFYNHQRAVTASKVKILGGPAVYRPELLSVCEKEALPKEFGGECECPGGCSLSDVGPWNPSGSGSEAESEVAASPTESASEKTSPTPTLTNPPSALTERNPSRAPLAWSRA